MKLKNLVVAGAVFLFAAGGAFAQDDFDSFGDDSFSDDSFGGDSFGDDSFGGFDSFDDSSVAESPFTFSGDLSLDTRYYFAKDDSERFLRGRGGVNTTGIRIGDDDADNDTVGVTDTKLAAIPKAKLGVDYSGSITEASLRLNFTEDVIKNHPEDVIDELVLRGYFLDNHLTIEAGKMKVVWGKGDKLHVLDNFNADDYTDYIIPDYIDRRISTPMLRGVYSSDVASLRVEGVFTPFLPKDRNATEGMWVPQQYATLMQGLMTVAANRYNGHAGNFDALYDDALDAKKSIDPDTNSLKYSQAGLHVTGTAGALDWGLSYYYGHYKQPSANRAKIVNALQASAAALAYYQQVKGTPAAQAVLAGMQAAAANAPYPELDYDRKQTLGVEAATVVGRFNLRGEFAYNLTDDTAGDDPWVHNNSIGWLFGFDIDLPISNINVNIQETGTYILNKDKIEDGTFYMYDVDYNKEGRYTNDRLVVNISDSWMNERIKPELMLMWGIERGDWIVQPKLSYSPSPELTFTASGMIISCRDEDSEFYYWKNNNFVNLGVRYQF